MAGGCHPSHACPGAAMPVCATFSSISETVWLGAVRRGGGNGRLARHPERPEGLVYPPTHIPGGRVLPGCPPKHTPPRFLPSPHVPRRLLGLPQSPHLLPARSPGPNPTRRGSRRAAWEDRHRRSALCAAELKKNRSKIGTCSSNNGHNEQDLPAGPVKE
jgi:hypothetical protein